MGRGIYVESSIAASAEEVWLRTQDPALHQRWDLRFSEIVYLPRPDPEAPQRFRYTTRVGLGLAIEGTGETTGATDKGGIRSSALRFASDDPKSLIVHGSGYWRYVPVPGGTRFLTWYDYDVRFGALGKALDLLFRPLMGWATALSFDRLRLWIEAGVPPEASLRGWWAHLVSRWALAAVFVYQGLVPKLLYAHPDELAMMEAGGIPPSLSGMALTALGGAEVVFGLFVLASWRWRWPLVALALAMPAVTVGVAVTAPGFLVSAFNAVALNVSVAALGIVGWLSSKQIPSSRRCLRRPPEGS